MKATGIVRRIDDLGRVVIPKEIRRTMRIRGRPVTDDIGMVGAVFLRHSESGKTAGLGSYILKIGIYA